MKGSCEISLYGGLENLGNSTHIFPNYSVNLWLFSQSFHKDSSDSRLLFVYTKKEEEWSLNIPFFFCFLST